MAIKDLIPWSRSEKKAPVKRDSYSDPIYGLQHNINQLFDDFFSRPFDLTPFNDFGESFGAFRPQVDVSENDKDITVTAELPGLTDDDIEVSLSHDVLSISGEKKEEKEDKGKDYYHVERSYGSFKRNIPLPAEIEADKVDATFKDGVLTITLPKTPEAQTQRKRIAVKSA